MRDKIIKILSNWLTFMDKEKLNKLRIDKNKNGKSKLKNEQYINYSQISIDNSFFNIKLSNEQYEEFKIISKYFNFLTLSKEEKEKFLKEDEIDDKIYFSCFLLTNKYEDNSYKSSRYFYPILAIPMKTFRLNGQDLVIEDVNDITDYTILKNILIDKLMIDENSIVDGENIIEFFSKLINQNLRAKNFLEIVSIVSSWIENRLIEIDSPYELHKTADLPDFLISQLDVEDFVIKLYEDIKNKRDNNFKALDNLEKHKLACDYLFAEPKKNTNIPTEQIYKGAFGNYPLALGQAIVMQQVQNEENMIAVQGAPGTGKTTLLLSMIANRITRRALALIKNDDFDNLMLITSTSNKAVDNVSEAFSKDFEKYSWLYFIWGSDSKRNPSLVRLQQTISILKDDNNKFDDKELNNLANSIMVIDKDIDKSLEEYKLLKNNIEDTKQKIERCKLDINLFDKDIKIKLENIKSLKNIIQNEYEKLINNDLYKNSRFYNEFINDIKNLKSIKINAEFLEEIESYKNNFERINKLSKEFYIEEMQDNKSLIDKLYKSINDISVEMTKTSFLIFIQNLFGRKNALIKNFIALNENIVKKCFKEANFNNFEDILKLSGKIQYFDTNISKIKFSLNECEDFLENLNLYNTFEKKYNERINLINSDTEKIKILENNLQEYQIKLNNFKDLLTKYVDEFESKYKDSFLTYFKNNFHQQNVEMFELSLKYIWQIILKNKIDITKSLEEWQYSMTTFNQDDRKSEFNKNLYSHKKNISLVYPVMTSTLASSMSLLFTPKMDIYDFLIVDEAGMITPNLLFPLICKSKRAMVVGDPKQLEPIVTLDEKEKEEYKEKDWKYIETQETKKYIEYQKYSPTMSNAYHRAAKCQTVEFDDIGDGIELDEHRRCLSDIAKIFIDIAKYDRLKIETNNLKLEDKHYIPYNNLGNKSLHYFDVQIDSMKDNVNTNEIEEINKVLNFIEESGFDLQNDVGIITPYRNQASKLISRFKMRINHTRKLEKIGTVHKFQGAEFPIVIFSPVVGTNDSINFINSKPNMLNVAVSRAKFVFMVVGNIELLKKGTYSNKMIIEQNIE
ncbi:AAA domain-containing protein [Aliarcobacter butzleri]|uniref:AAA domain-containing protein n=1 Tax=Aliarcobacter butzleri TaxID=28197 RepID=UPI003AF867D9